MLNEVSVTRWGSTISCRLVLLNPEFSIDDELSSARDKYVMIAIARDVSKSLLVVLLDAAAICDTHPFVKPCNL